MFVEIQFKLKIYIKKHRKESSFNETCSNINIPGVEGEFPRLGAEPAEPESTYNYTHVHMYTHQYYTHMSNKLTLN